jgi:glycosyltransferase involved in cell wall biosynthesis
MTTLPRFLVGTSAYNVHVQQMVLALLERDALDTYVTGGVDCFQTGLRGVVRQALRAGAPSLDRELGRRAIGIPCEMVETRWRWEVPRIVANRIGARRVEDWWWERGERALDAACARRISRPDVGGFIGVEHGALASLRAAQHLGKPSIVAFLSPHHRARQQWVDPEYTRDPALRTSTDEALDRLAVSRDARRDVEAHTAQWVLTGSSFTARTLVDAGVAADKILVVVPGGPEPMPAAALPTAPSPIVRIVFVGTAAVHKGAHLLLQAWRHVARPGVELHFYGQVKLPSGVVRTAVSAPGGDALFMHGSVPAAALGDVYRGASLLVFPTLCDGFGMVVSEAFAHGLPVLTTTNAGAADLVSPGENGLVVPPGNLDALIAALRWSVDHPEMLFRMRCHALEAASRRTWSTFRDDFARTLAGAIASVEPSESTRQALA